MYPAVVPVFTPDELGSHYSGPPRRDEPPEIPEERHDVGDGQGVGPLPNLRIKNETG